MNPSFQKKVITLPSIAGPSNDLDQNKYSSTVQYLFHSPDFCDTIPAFAVLHPVLKAGVKKNILESALITKL